MSLLQQLKLIHEAQGVIEKTDENTRIDRKESLEQGRNPKGVATLKFNAKQDLYSDSASEVSSGFFKSTK